MTIVRKAANPSTSSTAGWAPVEPSTAFLEEAGQGLYEYALILVLVAVVVVVILTVFGEQVRGYYERALELFG